MTLSDIHFQVGLSFPGEYRNTVQKVAEILVEKLGKDKIFYDKYHEAKLAVLNLEDVLQNIYKEQCDLIVVFFGKDYEEKEWCVLEWRAIREVIKTKIKNAPSAIMLIRMEDGALPGLFTIDGYIDARDRTPDDIASLIIQRVEINSNTSTNFKDFFPRNEDNTELGRKKDFLQYLLNTQNFNPITNKNYEFRVTIIVVIFVLFILLIGRNDEKILFFLDEGLLLLLLFLLLYNIVKRLVLNFEKAQESQRSKNEQEFRKNFKEQLKQNIIQSIFEEFDKHFENLYSVSVFVREDWVPTCKNPRPDYLIMDLYHCPEGKFDQKFVETFRPYFGDAPPENGVRGLAGYVLYKEKIKTIRIADVNNPEPVQSKDPKAKFNFLNFKLVDNLETLQYDFNFSIYIPIKSIINGQKLGTLCVDFNRENIENNELYIDEDDYTNNDNLPKQFLIFKNVAKNVAFYLEFNRLLS